MTIWSASRRPGNASSGPPASSPPLLPAFFGRSLSCPKNVSILDKTAVAQACDLRSRLLARIVAHLDEVSTPGDCADPGSRAAVDKTLQRLAARGLCCKLGEGVRWSGLRSSAALSCFNESGHMPQRVMVRPPSVRSSRRNMRSSQRFSSVRSKMTKWPACAAQRSM